MIQPVTTSLLTVAGPTVPIVGQSTSNQKIGAFQTRQNIWVADIAD